MSRISPQTNKRSSESGFTLMEVLVAMTLLGLLMAALSGTIGFVGRSADRGWEMSERSASLSRVEETMRRLVERSFPADIKDQTKTRFVFSGTAQRMRLVAYDAAGMTSPGLYVQEMEDVAIGNQHRLMFRRRPFTGYSPQTSNSQAQASEAALLAGDFSFRFSYFGAPRPGVARAWLDEWLFERNLPDLIRLQIADGGGAAWQTIVVRPIVTAEYACVSAQFTGVCRLKSNPQ
jgi:general secretion pathway protein J